MRDRSENTTHSNYYYYYYYCKLEHEIGDNTVYIKLEYEYKDRNMNERNKVKMSEMHGACPRNECN